MKRRLISVHKWAGLLMGLFWLLQGLSGAFLVFAGDVEDLAHGASWLTAPAADPGKAIAEGLTRVARETSDPVTRIVASSGGKHYLILTRTASNGVQAYRIDADRGVILARESQNMIGRDMSPVHFVRLFHTELLAGSTGHVIVGISGGILFVTILIGAFVGWPRRGAWKQALKLPRPRYKVGPLYGLHRGIGLWSSLLILILAFSGALLVWLADLQRLTGAQPPVPATSNEEYIPANIQRTTKAISIASATLPQARLSVVDTPRPETPYYRIRMLQPDESRRVFGTTAAYISADASQLMLLHDPLFAPLLNRIFYSIYPLHTGELIGFLGRILTVFSGLGLGALVISSAMLWLRKRPQK